MWALVFILATGTSSAKKLTYNVTTTTTTKPILKHIEPIKTSENREWICVKTKKKGTPYGLFHNSANGNPTCHGTKGNCSWFKGRRECDSAAKTPTAGYTCNSTKTVTAEKPWCDSIRQYFRRQGEWVCKKIHSESKFVGTFRIGGSGDPECAGPFRGCTWHTGEKSCENSMKNLEKGITCGEEYKLRYGSTGYDKVHWCEEMKRFFQGSSKWLCMKTNIGYGIFRNTLSNNPVCSGHKTVCYWYPTRQDCETELPFAKVGLTCGEDNWYVNGETGYEDKDSWCSEVRANLTASYVKYG